MDGWVECVVWWVGFMCVGIMGVYIVLRTISYINIVERFNIRLLN